MECKECAVKARLLFLHSINRNIVECKDRNPYATSYVLKVLIETLWNVKSCIRCNNVLRCVVLIETLWNVKYGLQGRTDCEWYVLIETLWNVKKLFSLSFHRV